MPVSRYLNPLLVGSFLLAAGALSANQDSQSALFNALVEPGESMRLSVSVFPDETGGTMRNLLNEDGELVKLEIDGLVKLRTPRLSLDSEYLLFEPESGNLEARGNVVVTREQVRAMGQRMVYNLETGEVEITGEPEVEQQTEENFAEFSGMEILRIEPGEEGRLQVLMTGGERIIGVMTGMGSDGTTSATASTEGPRMSGLGDDVRITTRPKGETAANVRLNMGEGGVFELFRAEGRVLVESTQMNLRADQFEYNALAQRMEALYNVFIRQDRVTAECGRMVYDLVEDVITLSVDPEIREERGPGTVARIFDIAAYIIRRNPDGTTSTESVPDPKKESQMVFESADPNAGAATNGATPSDDPGEIIIDGDSPNGF